MSLVTFLMTLAATAPSLTEGPAAEAAQGTGPGFAGFVATALLAIAVIFLIRDMVRRIRRVRYTAETEQRQQDLVEKGKKIQPDEE